MRSRIIAVTGAKGSPGCSFVAAALARSLVDSGITTLLADADAEGGGLAAMLDVRTPRLASAGGLGTVDAGAVRDAAAEVAHGLWFAELDSSTPGPFDGLELAGAARAGHDAVVLDLGHAAGPLQIQLAAASDWLLWVVVPDRVGLERADRALSSAQLAAGSTGLVFNRIDRHCLAGAEDVLSINHRLPVMGRIKSDRRLAACVARGRAAHRERTVRSMFRELARSVHPDARGVTNAWP